MVIWAGTPVDWCLAISSGQMLGGGFVRSNSITVTPLTAITAKVKSMAEAK
jgi:hypothetical protein